MSNIILKQRIPEHKDKVWLDRYINDTFTLFPSRKSIRKAIKRGEVLLDGKICSSNTLLCAGQILEVFEDLRTPHRVFKLPIRILKEDDSIAIIEKPPGFPVNGNLHKTVENALPGMLKKSSLEDALKWPRPVHRLDAATGGLLVVAKTGRALVDLGRQFQSRTIRKRYRALVIGRIENNGSVFMQLDGKEAETTFQPVAYAPSLKNRWLTLLDIWPGTGRFHQIRRHLSHIGFPILGDPLYGIKGTILRSKGLFLWSVEICLRHPLHGWNISVIINTPQKFQTTMIREKRRWNKYI